jgi:hypothetical protein
LHRREICVSFLSSKWQQFCFSLVLQFCTFLCRSSTLIFRGFVESQYIQWRFISWTSYPTQQRKITMAYHGPAYGLSRECQMKVLFHLLYY